MASPQQLPPSQPRPPIIDFVNVLAEKVDPLVKFLTAIIERYQQGQERKVRFQTRMSWVAIFVVLFIVGVAAVLTYFGKIEGSTFGFLLGLIVGYVLTFVRDQITPSD